MGSELFLSILPKGIIAANGVEWRLLAEYGAVFVAQKVQTPPKIVFEDDKAVRAFQSGMSVSAENIGGFEMELQAQAMDDLRTALMEAKSSDLSISPRDSDSARRSYSETVDLWASRVEPALKHWVGLEKLTQAQANRIRALSAYEQVAEVFELEDHGLFFAKDLSKSIIYSVAPPGTSQHLSMLALDVKEHEDARVRDLLAKHKWYQTVVSDLPHFTYLGVEESELPALGLKNVMQTGRTFWVPDI